MMTKHELEQAASYLARGMAHDTTLGLAVAAAWLDPLRFCENVYEDDMLGNEEDPETLTRFAATVARDCSPRLYVEVMQGLRRGLTFAQFEHAFCDALRKQYPHLAPFSLYDMIYGLPLDFCGLEPTSPEFLTHYHKLAAILLRYFGVNPVSAWNYQQDTESMAIPDDQIEAAREVARPVIDSLIDQDRQPYADLSLLLMYLFSITGNSLLDYTVDEYWDAGFEQFQWDSQGLEIADEAMLQARLVLDAADRALKALEMGTDIAQALFDNVAAASAALERKETHVHLTWPARSRNRCAAKSYRRAAGADAGLLFVRHCYAQDDR